MEKPRYRFCWECSRQLVGNAHAEVVTPQGQTVIVHKVCAEDAKNGTSRYDKEADQAEPNEDEDR